MPKIRDVWHDPVWSKVIAGAIIAGATTTVAYRLDWWPSIVAWFTVIFRYLAASTLLPNWLWIAGAIFISAALFAIVFIVVNLLRESKQSSTLTWKDYKSGHFVGLLWYWNYYLNDVTGLYSCCPECKCQLQTSYGSTSYGRRSGWYYHCDACDRVVKESDEDPSDVEAKVMRLIGQKLRSGAWEKDMAGS